MEKTIFYKELTTVIVIVILAVLFVFFAYTYIVQRTRQETRRQLNDLRQTDWVRSAQADTVPSLWEMAGDDDTAIE